MEGLFKAQPVERPEKCLPCPQRQYNEHSSPFKSGYRNVSPLFNGLETTGNIISSGLRRPVYKDSTVVLPDGTLLNTNMFTSSPLTETRQVRPGFCFTCHNADIELLGDDPNQREVPQLSGLQANFDPSTFRPLRDFVLVDASGNQVLLTEPGSPRARRKRFGLTQIEARLLSAIAFSGDLETSHFFGERR